MTSQVLEGQMGLSEASCHDRPTYHSYSLLGLDSHSHLLPIYNPIRRASEEGSGDPSFVANAFAGRPEHRV